MVSETMRVLGAASSSIDGFGVVRRVAVVDDRPDDARVAAAVGVFEDQRVETVLGVQHVVHPAVDGQHADAADAPLVGASPVVQQPVDVHRLMRTVESADPEMHDADADFIAVVVRLVDRDLRQASNCSVS